MTNNKNLGSIKIINTISLPIYPEWGCRPPFSGEFYNHKSDGLYLHLLWCKAVSSVEKYDSGTGWPSFKEAFQEKYQGNKGFISQYDSN